MMMFSFAWRWSSLTHALALSSDACVCESQYLSPVWSANSNVTTYGLRNVVYDDGTVGVSVVHGRQRLVSLLASRVPNLKLDRRVLIERDGLGEESRSNGRFPERVELILMGSR